MLPAGWRAAEGRGVSRGTPPGPFDAAGVETHDAPGESLNRTWRRAAQGPCGVLASAGHADQPGRDDRHTHDSGYAQQQDDHYFTS